MSHLEIGSAITEHRVEPAHGVVVIVHDWRIAQARPAREEIVECGHEVKWFPVASRMPATACF